MMLNFVDSLLRALVNVYFQNPVTVLLAIKNEEKETLKSFRDFSTKPKIRNRNPNKTDKHFILLGGNIDVRILSIPQSWYKGRENC